MVNRLCEFEEVGGELGGHFPAPALFNRTELVPLTSLLGDRTSKRPTDQNEECDEDHCHHDDAERFEHCVLMSAAHTEQRETLPFARWDRIRGRRSPPEDLCKFAVRRLPRKG